MGKNFNQPIIWRATYYYMGDFKVQYKKKDVPWYLKPFNIWRDFHRYIRPSLKCTNPEERLITYTISSQYELDYLREKFKTIGDINRYYEKIDELMIEDMKEYLSYIKRKLL